MLFLSTVCDEGSADLLYATSPSAFKIASYELNHLPLLKYVAGLKTPIIFSTAGADISDIQEAYQTITGEGNKEIAIMHCVAKYPAPPEYSNLSVIPMLAAAFPDAVIGFSDHSAHPYDVPCAAVRLGAKLIEKHFTIDKNLPGADHSFALNPDELKEMVAAIRSVEAELRQGITLRCRKCCREVPIKRRHRLKGISEGLLTEAFFQQRRFKKANVLRRKTLPSFVPAKNRRGFTRDILSF